MVPFLVILLLFLILLIITRDYKKQYIKELHKGEHRLKCLYSLTMFLEDRVFYKFNKFTNNKVSNSIKALLIKENIVENLYLIKIKKLSTCLCIFLGFFVIGLISSIEEGIAGRDNLERIQRPGYGEGKRNYNLVAIIEGEKETLPIKLEIDEQKYTYEQSLSKIEEGYKELLSKMLGENKALDNITKPLNLMNTVNGIKISWKIEDTQILNFNGKVNSENIGQEGVLIYIYAILSLGEVEKEYEIPLIVNPIASKPKSIEEEVITSIQENSSAYEKEIILPKEIKEKKITFISLAEKESVLYIFLGIFGAVSLYFTLNRELYAKVRKRNAQMLIDYPEIVSKLTLLMEAGLSISGAWNRIIEDYDKSIKNNKRYAYEEMRLTNIKMKNGTPEATAYSEFGKRCNLQPYIRLSNLLEQNLTKGTKGVKSILEQEVSQAFQDRKNSAKIRGEEASTKLLLPMILMLGIVIVIIVVPSFLSMKW